MLDISEDFLWQFRHLEGDVLGEQRKNLFRLLRKENLFSNTEQLSNTLKSLHPETHVENLFYVETLIHFKRTPELVEILKQGNGVYISKIFKHSWFFKEAFKDVDPGELVNEFLPHLSFVVRMKLLKWLSVHLSEAEMDKIFDCLLKRYGLRIASNILHACSSTKIISVLSNDEFEIKLKPNQAKTLFDKDLPTFLYYLQYYKHITGSFYNVKNVFKHIGLKNPTVLLKMKENVNSCQFHLGRRTSKKIVELAKDDLVKNINDYTDIVNQSVMVRKLKSSFKTVYCDLFPRVIKDLNSYCICNKLLQCYPEKRRWGLFMQTFSQIFTDKNVSDILSDFDDGLVKICTEKEIIYKWAEIKYTKLDNNTYLKYFKPEKAFSIIKKKINATSKWSDRQKLFEIMLDCCKQNKDMDTLEKVLQYICVRHRNGPPSCRESLLNHIQNNFKIDSFSESHWKYIKEILDMIQIGELYYGDYLLKKYIEFLYKNKGRYKEVLKDFMKSRPGYYCMPSSLDLGNPTLEKELIIIMASTLPEVLDKDHKMFIITYWLMIAYIVEFDSNNKEYSIFLSDFPHLIEYMNDVLKGMKDMWLVMHGVVTNAVSYNTQFPERMVAENSKLLEIILADSLNEDFQFSDLVERMICKKKRSESENEMMKRYFEEILDKHVCHGINVWFMRNDPSSIYPHMDKIIAKYTDVSVIDRIYDENYFRGIKYSRFNFQVKLVDVFKKHLNNPKCNRKQLINHLIYLATTEELVEIVEKQFLPKKEKLDLQDEEIKETFEVQCHIAKSLGKVMDPLKILPLVCKFAVGDYLKYALQSLYSIFYRTPEKELYSRADDLSKKAVSVKKHASFLSCEVLNAQFTANILKTINKKNVSSEKHRFSSILKYFVKNPSQDLFDLLILNLYVTDKNDKETLEKLSSIYMPKKYRGLYIEKCWQFFETIKKEVNIINYLYSILDIILKASPENILQLSSEFCTHVISSYLTKTEDVPNNIEMFTCHVLLYCKAEQIANFNLVFEIIAKHKRNNQTDRIKEFSRNMHIVASKELYLNFVKLCDEHWNNLFTPIEMFYEFLLIKLLVLRSTTTEPFLKNYARSVVTFSEDLVAQYDLFIFQYFKKALQEDLSNAKQEEKLLFLYHVLKCKATKLNCILVLDLMGSTSEDDSEEIIKVYKDILEILKNIDNPNVKMHYNLKFN